MGHKDRWYGGAVRAAGVGRCKGVRRHGRTQGETGEEEIDELGVVEFPSKAVCTRKAPDGRRKVRGVVCGNFASSSANEDTYASGADATQIRSLAKLDERMVYGGHGHPHSVSRSQER